MPKKLKKTKSKKGITPKPLPARGYDVPPMPTNLLPAWPQRIVQNVSAVTKTPPEFAAAPLVVMISLLLSNKYEIVTDSETPQYSISGNLSGLVCAASGNNKSGAVQAVMACLEILGKKVAKEFNKAFPELKSFFDKKKIQNEEKKKKAKKLLKTADDIWEEDPAESAALEEQATKLLIDSQVELFPPKQKVVVCNDATPAAFAKHFSRQTFPIMLFRDEFPRILTQLLGSNSDRLRTFAMEAMDGKNDSSVDSFSDKFSFKMVAPKLSLFGTAQPAVMSKIVNSIKDGSIPDDGLLYRFQIFIMSDMDSLPTYSAATLHDKEALDQLYHFVTQLDDGEICAIVGSGKRTKVYMEEDAEKAYHHYMKYLNYKLSNENLSVHLYSHLSKYRSMVPSIALVIAAFRQYEENDFEVKRLKPITLADMKMAIRWAKYLERHVKKLWQSADERLENAKLILSRMDELDDSFSSRDLQQKCWKGLRKNLDKINEALTCLQEHHYLSQIEVLSSKGGRPAIRWVKHPDIERTPKEPVTKKVVRKKKLNGKKKKKG
ncbi:DUF3987 domain-containing protein [Rheinheimera sp. 1928-s]|uniref:DUF3987 domain-containing protein n=1 Tax=Rheinheimera sp. 1928-s TaxID=3033803 RepID=UPI00261405DD|nr:DUF3987 domain-containing protein [Rheinheimera sp. 1928-s]MDF3124673.1 DUF3987 domain-containing protein [Rheinheimera sp. 1928-s]